MREAVERIGRSYSRLPSHPYEQQMLVVEVDLTGLRASKKAELSTKGYFSGERNAMGRQLVRASTPDYGEVIFSKLYPGNTTSCEVLKQTLGEVERVIESSSEKRQKTLVHLDGGFGTDENIEWLCLRGYQFVVKGYGGGRANKLARCSVSDLKAGSRGQPQGSCWASCPLSRSPPLLPPDQDRPEEMERREGQALYGLPRKHFRRSHGR